MIYKMRSLSLATLIVQLKGIFAFHGIPVTLNSDNGLYGIQWFSMMSLPGLKLARLNQQNQNQHNQQRSSRNLDCKNSPTPSLSFPVQRLCVMKNKINSIVQGIVITTCSSVHCNSDVQVTTCQALPWPKCQTTTQSSIWATSTS